MYAISEGIVFKSVYELKCDTHCASSRKNDSQIHGQNGPHTPTKKGIMFKSTGTQPKNKPCVPVNTSSKESLTNIIAKFFGNSRKRAAPHECDIHVASGQHRCPRCDYTDTSKTSSLITQDLDCSIPETTRPSKRHSAGTNDNASHPPASKYEPTKYGQQLLKGQHNNVNSEAVAVNNRFGSCYLCR